MSAGGGDFGELLAIPSFGLGYSLTEIGGCGSGNSADFGFCELVRLCE